MRKRWRAALAIGMAWAAGMAQAACKVSSFAEIPVTMVGPRAMLDAKIGDRAIRLMADSGAF